jgi:phage antirepressor YoqD-like protein
MSGLKYIEYNGQPVISARNLYAYLTEGTGEQVGAWLTFCKGHHLFTMGDDLYEITTPAGNPDLLLTPTAASVVCVSFKDGTGKQAFQMIRDMIEYQVVNVDLSTKDDTIISIHDAAKILNMDEGPNELFKLLRDTKVLTRRNVPMQHYVEKGYFKVITAEHHKLDGKVMHYAKAMVTPAGLQYITYLINKQRILQEGAA